MSARRGTEWKPGSSFKLTVYWSLKTRLSAVTHSNDLSHFTRCVSFFPCIKSNAGDPVQLALLRGPPPNGD